MDTIKTFFKLEARLLRSKIFMAFLGILLLLSLFFIQDGISKYKAVIETIDTFRKYENSKVQKYNNGGQYGTYGAWVLFIPSPQSIYFSNSSTISELNAGLDSGERLKIYNSFKGRSLFTEKSGGFKDFSGIMLLLGSFFALLLGYESVLHRDYLRFMVCTINVERLFFTIFLSRIVIITIFLTMTTGLSLIQLKLNGIPLAHFEYNYLMIYLGVMILIWVFFFSIGTLAGYFKSRLYGFVMLTIFWFFFIFFLPSVINFITYQKTQDIVAEFKMDQEKFKIMMDAENNILKRTGSLNKADPRLVSKLASESIDKDFPAVFQLEKQLEDKMTKNIRLYQGLSILFPSTFYLSSVNEISSKGYANFIRFYQYVQELKGNFLRYILPNYNIKVEYFFKKGEEIFTARPGLPDFFGGGIILMLIYIFGFAGLSYHLFKKSLKL